jgi:hypothetical protein
MGEEPISLVETIGFKSVILHFAKRALDSIGAWAWFRGFLMFEQEFNPGAGITTNCSKTITIAVKTKFSRSIASTVQPSDLAGMRSCTGLGDRSAENASNNRG